MNCCMAAQNTITSEFTIQIPQFLSIQPMTSPVLIAHIHNNTGNLYSLLSTKFRVVTNCKEKKLYLNAVVHTESGEENALFSRGGQVFMAFGNMQELPTTEALLGCKRDNESKGVVAYPVLYVSGADNKFIPSEEKYEIYLRNNGTYFIDITVGTNVLKSSFDSKDKKGFYQAIVSLTEADI